MGYQRNQKGFTLIELIIVISILGVLSAIAAPTIRNQIIKMRMRYTTEQIVNCFRESRLKSVTLQKDVAVSLIPSSNSMTCGSNAPFIFDNNISLQLGSGGTNSDITFSRNGTVTGDMGSGSTKTISNNLEGYSICYKGYGGNAMVVNLTPKGIVSVDESGDACK